jgi:hypothetical protein
MSHPPRKYNGPISDSAMQEIDLWIQHSIRCDLEEHGLKEVVVTYSKGCCFIYYRVKVSTMNNRYWHKELWGCGVPATDAITDAVKCLIRSITNTRIVKETQALKDEVSELKDAIRGMQKELRSRDVSVIIADVVND